MLLVLLVTWFNVLQLKFWWRKCFNNGNIEYDESCGGAPLAGWKSSGRGEYLLCARLFFPPADQPFSAFKEKWFSYFLFGCILIRMMKISISDIRYQISELLFIMYIKMIENRRRLYYIIIMDEKYRWPFHWTYNKVIPIEVYYDCFGIIWCKYHRGSSIISQELQEVQQMNRLVDNYYFERNHSDAFSGYVERITKIEENLRSMEKSVKIIDNYLL